MPPRIHSLSTPGIQSRIAYPTNASSSRPLRMAIIAHPWARLGGNWNDPIVQLVQSIFIECGIPVVLFNGRGAGETTGRPSWGGQGEVEDYGKVLQAGWRHLLANGGSSHGPREEEQLFLCGYSYGSLPAINQTGLPPHIKASYLLISMPLGVRYLLAPSLSTCIPPVSSLSSSASSPSRTLAIHTTQDDFTGIERYRRWSEVNESVSLRVIEVDDEGHFWRKAESREVLIREVKSWIEEGSTTTDDPS